MALPYWPIMEPTVVLIGYVVVTSATVSATVTAGNVRLILRYWPSKDVLGRSGLGTPRYKGFLWAFCALCFCLDFILNLSKCVKFTTLEGRCIGIVRYYPNIGRVGHIV